MEKYQLTITKITPNPDFDEEKYNNRSRYSTEQFPDKYIQEVLNIRLTDKQYEKLKKEALTVF